MAFVLLLIYYQSGYGIECISKLLIFQKTLFRKKSNGLQIKGMQIGSVQFYWVGPY
jgi:hypothetical protein